MSIISHKIFFDSKTRQSEYCLLIANLILLAFTGSFLKCLTLLGLNSEMGILASEFFFRSLIVREQVKTPSYWKTCRKQYFIVRSQFCNQNKNEATNLWQNDLLLIVFWNDLVLFTWQKASWNQQTQQTMKIDENVWFDLQILKQSLWRLQVFSITST